jgi:hypothetical protein
METVMKSQDDKATLSRRRLFAGAGAAGAVAGVAALVSRAPEPQPEPVAALPAPEAGGGYQLTEHVKRYYQTTRV